MKILMAHNAYRQRGGEDKVFELESALLERAGHQVNRFLVGNDHIEGISAKVSAAVSMLNNKRSVCALMEEVSRCRPDIVHFHNFFPTLSPAALAAVAEQGIAVVQTLHNYRLICAGAMLLREGRPCELCVGHSRLPGVIHRCYRSSLVGSALIGRMGKYFKSLLKRHPRGITLIALTEFAKSRFVEDGYNPGSIIVRGNSIPDPGAMHAARDKRIVYVGRLSAEKGVELLIKAMDGANGQLEIIGDGPERQRLEAIAPANVAFLGQLESPQVFARINSATALAVPSLWYEGFPMVVLEAMATGTPVIASDIGSLAEIVQHERTGLLVTPGDADAWAKSIALLLGNPALASILGQAARERFLEYHSEEAGLTSLMAIYEKARNKDPVL